VHNLNSRRIPLAPIRVVVPLVPASLYGFLIIAACPAQAQMSSRGKDAPMDLSYLWAAVIGVAVVCLVQRVSNNRRDARRRRERHRDRSS
jgi:hypothetical protein